MSFFMTRSCEGLDGNLSYHVTETYVIILHPSKSNLKQSPDIFPHFFFHRNTSQLFTEFCRLLTPIYAHVVWQFTK